MKKPEILTIEQIKQMPKSERLGLSIISLPIKNDVKLALTQNKRYLSKNFETLGDVTKYVNNTRIEKILSLNNIGKVKLDHLLEFLKSVDLFIDYTNIKSMTLNDRLSMNIGKIQITENLYRILDKNNFSDVGDIIERININGIKSLLDLNDFGRISFKELLIAINNLELGGQIKNQNDLKIFEQTIGTNIKTPDMPTPIIGNFKIGNVLEYPDLVKIAGILYHMNGKTNAEIRKWEKDFMASSQGNQADVLNYLALCGIQIEKDNNQR